MSIEELQALEFMKIERTKTVEKLFVVRKTHRRLARL